MSDDQTPPEKQGGIAAHVLGISILLVCLAVIVGIVWVIPKEMARLSRADLKGIPEQTAMGTVVNTQDNPGNPGGSGPYNSVVLSFAGHQIYWNLPATSRWNPHDGEAVKVTYRVGRLAGHMVYIDNVAWGDGLTPPPTVHAAATRQSDNPARTAATGRQ